MMVVTAIENPRKVPCSRVTHSLRLQADRVTHARGVIFFLKFYLLVKNAVRDSDHIKSTCLMNLMKLAILQSISSYLTVTVPIVLPKTK